MKKVYEIPTIEIIAAFSEDLLSLSTFDPNGILDDEADCEWFK